MHHLHRYRFHHVFPSDAFFSIFFIILLVVPFDKSPARSLFFIWLVVFLVSFACFPSRIVSQGYAYMSSFAPTSIIGRSFSNESLAFLYQWRNIHEPVSSFHSLCERFSLFNAIPFSFANFSHFVSGFGGGGGKARGSAISSYVGRVTIGPTLLFLIGNRHNESNNCEQPSVAFCSR